MMMTKFMRNSLKEFKTLKNNRWKIKITFMRLKRF